MKSISTMKRPLLHVIDGSGYIFRAYYAIRALSNPEGEATNAVYGFTTMIEKALREEQPELLAITFDAGGANFRREIYPEYKANRPPPPEDLSSQIPRIHQIAEAFRIKTFVEPNVEADDVIASLVRWARKKGHKVVIVSADKDLLQLVGDGVVMYDTMRDRVFGVPETVEDDPAAVVGIEATSACPVCGKAVDITNPPASVDYGDTHYLLCSESCLTAFQRSPKDFLRTEPLEKR